MTVRTRDLLRLIDNLLNLSKLESGTVVFNLEPTSGHEIIADILEVTTPQAEAKNITITYSPCDEDWRFNVDYDHIRTAIMNIISNAIKYTPDGGSVNVSTSFPGDLPTWFSVIRGLASTVKTCRTSSTVFSGSKAKRHGISPVPDSVCRW